MQKKIIAVDNENLVKKCAHVEHVEIQLNDWISEFLHHGCSSKMQ